MSSNYTQYLGAKRCCDLKVQGPQGYQGATGPSAVGSMGYQGATGVAGNFGQHFVAPPVVEALDAAVELQLVLLRVTAVG